MGFGESDLGPWSKAAASAAAVNRQIAFEGRRSQLFGRLLRGYLLMLPTLGVYRFWVTTAKRRFYWQNTIIDGDPLEYTGNARQLLFGFLFAVAFFLPVYIAFFVLSTQAGVVTIAGYGVLGVLLWFFIGYAQYRGRDFRLSRTLWRGIRFDQKGSALTYAIRRFLWSLLVVVTLGLAYPFMSASLWRYRYSHTWFGDRQVSFSGTWKTIAGPFYRAYGLVALTIAVFVGLAAAGNPAALQLAPLGALIVGSLAFFYWRSREATRMLSQIGLGEARVTARVRARTLFGQYFVLGLLLLAVLLAAAVIGGVIVGVFYRDFNFVSRGDFRSLAFTGLGGAAIVVGGYLLAFGTFSILGETVIDLGYWKAVARDASIANVESLRDVRAIGEDHALLGEGLADALNVGSF